MLLKRAITKEQIETVRAVNRARSRQREEQVCLIRSQHDSAFVVFMTGDLSGDLESDQAFLSDCLKRDFPLDLLL